ncbi:MAG TPA: hypothetical protein VGD75_22195 [Bradyrhizobium sp.]
MLEDYLDGQLPAADAQRLARRLAIEQPLAEELSALRAQRAVRQAVFDGLEPKADEAQAFARRVIGASRRQSLRARFASATRIGAGIAASVALGFVAGWLGRGHGSAPVIASAAPKVQIPPAVARESVASAGSNTSHTVNPVSQINGPFQVSLTDPDGKVLAVQKFDRIEDANAFADLVSREARRLQSNNDLQPVVYAEQF